MSERSSITPDLLTCTAVVFVTLKLGGAVDWSWFVVLTPLWLGPAAIAMLSTLLIPAWLADYITRRNRP